MHNINQLALLRWGLRGTAAIVLTGGAFAPAMAQKAPTTIRLSPQDAERGLNGHQHNFDFLAPGESGDNYRTAGFFGQKLRPYLGANSEALADLDKYRRQKTIFLVDRLVAVGAFGVYGQQIFANGEAQYFNNTQKVALGVFATSVLATVFINRNTNTYLQRAVSAYNASLAKVGPWHRLRPTSVGLGASPTGQPLLALRWNLR